MKTAQNYTQPNEIIQILKSEIAANADIFEFVATQYLIHPALNKQVLQQVTGLRYPEKECTSCKVIKILKTYFTEKQEFGIAITLF